MRGEHTQERRAPPHGGRQRSGPEATAASRARMRSVARSSCHVHMQASTVRHAHSDAVERRGETGLQPLRVSAPGPAPGTSGLRQCSSPGPALGHSRTAVPAALLHQPGRTPAPRVGAATTMSGCKRMMAQSLRVARPFAASSTAPPTAPRPGHHLAGSARLALAPPAHACEGARLEAYTWRLLRGRTAEGCHTPPSRAVALSVTAPAGTRYTFCDDPSNFYSWPRELGAVVVSGENLVALLPRVHPSGAAAQFRVLREDDGRLASGNVLHRPLRRQCPPGSHPPGGVEGSGADAPRSGASPARRPARARGARIRPRTDEADATARMRRMPLVHRQASSRGSSRGRRARPSSNPPHSQVTHLSACPFLPAGEAASEPPLGALGD